MSELNDDPVITIQDIREAGFCVLGLAKWFKDQDLSYKDLKAGKYRVSDFENWNDGYAQQVLRYIKTKRGAE